MKNLYTLHCTNVENSKIRIGDWTHIKGYLLPRVRLDLRELELCIVGVHFSDLLPGGCPEDFDDLHQLVDP
jgi:hypothetical protein